MTVENISQSISTKECCRPRRLSNPRPPGLQLEAHPTEPPRPAFCSESSLVASYRVQYPLLLAYMQTINTLIRLRGSAEWSVLAWWTYQMIRLLAQWLILSNMLKVCISWMIGKQQRPWSDAPLSHLANSVDPDQTPSSAASDLGLHKLQRPICPNTWVNTALLRRQTSGMARVRLQFYISES